MTVKCAGCGVEAPGGAPCPECGRFQPFPPGADRWAVLGLPRRLALDGEVIRQRVHALNRRLHPDYFRLRTAEEQALSLENSAAVNTAYRTLRDPLRRLEYLLEEEGLGLEAASGTRPPADLFEEIMEVQEARQELAAADPAAAPAIRARLQAARADLARRRDETEGALAACFPAWDEADEAGRRQLLAEMREALATRRYLHTVLRDLETTLGLSGQVAKPEATGRAEG